MRRVCTALLACLALAALAAGCGEDCPKLDGSQCELISCGFTELNCQRYAAPNDALKMNYKRTFDTGSEYTAILVIDLAGLPSAEGLHVEGQDFLDRVLFYRLEGNNWPDPDLDNPGKCDVTKGGDEIGADLEGKCSLRFDNGYSVSASFCCTLEDTDIP
ncbi:MAG TPA: hypothetical protein PK668_19155 [Myxococcota bacterium]|nr:hypothetical protein [Myxococcota bacterium]HRY95150.1 hypothetical protein [Myxococcota bacterium]